MAGAVYLMEAERAKKLTKFMGNMHRELESTQKILRGLIKKVPRKHLTKDALAWMKDNMAANGEDRKEIERTANEAYRTYIRLKKKLQD